MFVEHCGYVPVPVPTCMLYTYMYYTFYGTIYSFYVLLHVHMHLVVVLLHVHMHLVVVLLHVHMHLVVVLLHVVTVIMYTHVHVLMRDEGRKKEASKVKQTTSQSNTARPQTDSQNDMYMYL